jgi:cyclopropane-fatty-acyl-phospholipid synthase
MRLARMIDRVASRDPDASFTVRYWDGTEEKHGTGPDAFVVSLRDRRTVARLLANPSLRFGEAYVAGAIEVEGDLKRLMCLLLRLSPEEIRPSGLQALAIIVTRWRLRNSRRRARKNVHHHYDLGDEFFRLWLGSTMAYSCAYFRSSADDLDRAQEAKFRHISEKLRLEKAQQLLDIGCGWGGFAAYAATHYGVKVLGITLSAAQQRYAREMIEAQGLEDRVEIRLCDYRDLEPGRWFDRIVSIGMFEHVGRERMPGYFRETARLLADGGIGVLHTIGRMVQAPTDPWISTYVFPGAYFPALGEIGDGLGRAGLQVTDVEALGPHYALTLERWLEAFERQHWTIEAMYDARFVRLWRLYLCGSAAAFRVGNLTLWQVQFTKGPAADLPRTRDYLYQSIVDPANSPDRNV